MRQLAPSDPATAAFTRTPSRFPAVVGTPSSRLHLYVGLPCPWAHRTRGLPPGLRRRPRRRRRVSFTPDSPDELYGKRKLREVRGAAGSRAGRRCRCSGTPSAVRWSATRASRSSSSSAASRTPKPTAAAAAWTSGRRSCARRSTAGTASSTPASTTASTATAKTGFLLQHSASPFPLIKLSISATEFSDPNNCQGFQRRRCGFAQSQEAYDAATSELFGSLDRLEDHLTGSRYLCGDRFTLADVCLFTTLIRFDLVYNTLFRCTRRKLAEYPSLHAYTRDIYQMPKVAETCDMEAIMAGYFKTLFPLNPGGIQPLRPASCAAAGAPLEAATVS